VLGVRLGRQRGARYSGEKEETGAVHS
jgi:hypothetical protein